MLPFSPLQPRFFRRPAAALARALLGKVIVHETREGISGGMIVETEAYDESEPASHSWVGPTGRNRVMFRRAGLAYVYRSYGVHWCVNVVAGRVGEGAAVLIRAAQPRWGVERMLKRRGWPDDPRSRRDLLRGPGRLCAALGIDGSHDGVSLSARPLWIGAIPGPRRQAVTDTVRIGISKATDLPWRFILSGHPCVSGPASLRT